MQRFSQTQLIVGAALAGGLIVLLVVAVVLLSGGEDGSEVVAEGGKTTPTPRASLTVTRTPLATPKATSTPANESPTPSSASVSVTGEPVAATTSLAATSAPTAPPSATPALTATPTRTPQPTATATATQPPTPTPTATAAGDVYTVATGAWSGDWETSCGVQGFGGCKTLSLKQLGNLVTGSYGDGYGSLSGNVAGNNLHGTWSRGGETGTFDFWLDSTGKTFQGNFGVGYDWCGRRGGASLPSPCGVASFYGTWKMYDCPWETSYCATLVLQQSGQSVSGTLSYNTVVSTTSGTVSGIQLTLSYNLFGSSGVERFSLTPGGGVFFSDDNQGSLYWWCGKQDGISSGFHCPAR